MTAKWHLFEAYGIELEYMIVEKGTLKPLFICNKVLEDLAGKKTMNIQEGLVAWSNELALHVIELKANGPQKDLGQLEAAMAQAARKMSLYLARYNAQLMPTAMHPFFNPDDGSLKLWSDEDAEIYATYDRIFGCRGHGWGNLQSIHINLPFANDEEFFRLHTAIRLVLPLLPALAASSPYVEGKRGPLLASRVHYYLQNQRLVPSIIGDAIPEAIRSEQDYREKILKPMFRDIASRDPEGELQHEWLNSRAAIARFERDAIEIRLLDIQESVAGDFRLIRGISSVLKDLCARGDTAEQLLISQETLVAILHGGLKEQMDYRIKDKAYQKLLGGETIREICQSWQSDPEWQKLLTGGNLAQRLVKACGDKPDLKAYDQMSRCLIDNQIYAST